MEGDTVLVAAGTYSPSTNSEVFPIEMASGIHLIGSGEDVSIIDAQQTDRVITMEDCDNNTISDLTLTGGLADSYGGGMRLSNSNPILTNVTISNNTANWGGGMHLNASNPILNHVTISNNTAEIFGGGMVLFFSNPILNNMTISNNTASEASGMRLYDSDPILTHVIISNNTAEYHGGGMWLDYSDPILTHVTISNNTAEYYGGGMRLSNSNPILTNVTIANNTANNGGGGMYLNSANPIMNHVTITDNTANSKGGGIYCYTNNELTYTSNILIADNYSVGHGGGIFLSAGANINLQHATIAGNMVGEGDVFGAGIYSDGGTAYLLHSIAYYNRREGDFGINYNLNGYTMDMLEEFNVTYSDIEGDENWIPEGEANISLDPEFTDLEYSDYTLQEDSPCIDMGTVIEDMEYCGSAPDMGAYEYITEDCEECSDNIEGDTNFDGSVNILDIIIIANCILSDSCDICFDLNGDQDLDILDIVLIVNIILEN